MTNSLYDMLISGEVKTLNLLQSFLEYIHVENTPNIFMQVVLLDFGKYVF